MKLLARNMAWTGERLILASSERGAAETYSLMQVLSYR